MIFFQIAVKSHSNCDGYEKILNERIFINLFKLRVSFWLICLFGYAPSFRFLLHRILYNVIWAPLVMPTTKNTCFYKRVDLVHT